MTDSYVRALELDRDTRAAELERCRRDIERLTGDVDRMVADRDEFSNHFFAEREETKRLRAEVAQLNDLVRRGNDDEAALRAEVERLGRMLKASLEDDSREVERLTRERDGERAEREKVSAFKRQRDEEYEVVSRERDDALREAGNANAAVEQWKARAEQTERERDEWKATAERQNDLRIEAENEAAKARTRAEAAEADNAALLQALRESCSGMRALDWVDALVSRPHPGAALLKRLRAAEKVVEAARGNGGGYEDSWAVLSEALDAYDAAKEGA